MILIAPFEHGGDGVGEVVETRTVETVLVEFSDGFSPLSPAIFEIGRGSAHHRDEALEHLGNRLAGPTRGHRDADTAGTRKRGAAEAS